MNWLPCAADWRILRRESWSSPLTASTSANRRGRPVESTMPARTATPSGAKATASVASGRFPECRSSRRSAAPSRWAVTLSSGPSSTAIAAPGEGAAVATSRCELAKQCGGTLERTWTNLPDQQRDLVDHRDNLSQSRSISAWKSGRWIVTRTSVTTAEGACRRRPIDRAKRVSSSVGGSSSPSPCAGNCAGRMHRGGVVAGIAGGGVGSVPGLVGGPSGSDASGRFAAAVARRAFGGAD